MKLRLTNIRKIAVFTLLAAMVIMASACSSKQVKGAAPIVRLNGLNHAGESITLKLSMRNVNDVDLEVSSIDFSLSVEGDKLFSYSGPAETSISAHGIETWSIDVEENANSKELLDKLQNGSIVSLPYSLEGSVDTIEEGKMRFEHEGHLYPVPGKPGSFH